MRATKRIVSGIKTTKKKTKEKLMSQTKLLNIDRDLKDIILKIVESLPE